jgi:hypothetical protein
MSESNQPYEPPRSRVADPVERAPRPILGLVLGATADIGGTLLAGIVVSVIYSLQMASEGMSPEEMTAALANMPMDSSMGIAALAAGLLCSVWGGYVCAGFAFAAPFKWGGILATIVCVIGLLMGGSGHEPGVEIVLLAGTFAAVLTGVWLRARRGGAKSAA